MRKLLFAAFVSSAALFGPAATVAQACPMCAQANETEENRPKAYMYSILFMISMPALIFTGFSIGLYRLHRKHAANDAFDPYADQ